jgi:phospholipase/lecithinase/hemolysin
MRTLVAPNAVDLTKLPQYNSYPSRAFIRQRIIEFNNAYAIRLNQIKASSPGLTVFMPDLFALLDDVEANAAKYNLTNVLDDYGNVTSVQQNLIPAQAALLNGPGANYIWWGPIAPTARFHEVIADYVQQIISPVQIGSLTQINGSNRLDVVNTPVGLNGFLEGSTNLATASWTSVASFSSTTATQSIFVLTPPLPANFGSSGSGGSGGGGPPTPGSGTGSGTGTGTDTNSYVSSVVQLYRLRFPYAWNWP